MMPSDKERRHLVASIAVGLMARQAGRAIGGIGKSDVISDAFEIYDELIKQDDARELAKCAPHLRTSGG